MQWEDVNIFISSTFNDMHAERDYLVKRVFPQLSEWCEARKLRLNDIDLRWGVSEKDATENKRVVQVCLSRIDECRPFFLCFLGQRRGWVPAEDDIGAESYEAFAKLEEAGYAGNASVTEMEILHALIDPLHGGLRRFSGGEAKEFPAAEHAFFYLRDPGYLESLPPGLTDVYTNGADADPAASDAELARWRDEVIPGTGRPTLHYTARWDRAATTPEIAWPLALPTTAPAGSAAWQRALNQWRQQWLAAGVNAGEDGTLTGEELEKAQRHNAALTAGRLTGFCENGRELADIILEQLKEAITARFGERTPPAETPLQRELDQQAEFLENAARSYIEHEGDLQPIWDYVYGDADVPLAVTARPGMGKTSLLAHFIKEFESEQEWDGEDDPDDDEFEYDDEDEDEFDEELSLYYRFVGGSDGSAGALQLWRSLLEQMAKDGHLQSDVPAEGSELFAKLPELLAEAGQHSEILILIDALNQLEGGLKSAHWLPRQLPENVRMVVSFKLGDEEAEHLAERASREGSLQFYELAPFTGVEPRRQLVTAYLAGYFKELDDERVDALVTVDGAENPLFLKTVLSELRVYGAHQNLSGYIAESFGHSPAEAYDALLRRMEEDPAYSAIPPAVLVPNLFGWLSHARSGLTPGELAELLVAEGFCDDVSAARDAVQVVLRQLRGSLARRDGRVDFFYESFLLAARQRYTGSGGADASPPVRTAEEWHASLAAYFAQKPVDDRHRLMELAFQLARAGQSGALRALLLDYRHLQGKLLKFDIDALLEDFEQIDHLPQLYGEWEGRPLALLRSCLQMSAGILMRDKAALPGQLLGRMLDIQQPDIEALLRAARMLTRIPWLRPRSAFLDTPDSALVRELPYANDRFVFYTPTEYFHIREADRKMTLVDFTTREVTRVFPVELYAHALDIRIVDGVPFLLDMGSRDGADRAKYGFRSFFLKNIETGKVLQRFHYDEDPEEYRSIRAFLSPDGALVVSTHTGYSGTYLRIWDTATGEQTAESSWEYVKTFWHSGLNEACFLPGGTHIAVSSGDEKLAVINLSDLADVRLMDEAKGPHNIRTLGVCGGNEIYTNRGIWNADTGAHLMGFDAEYAAAANADGTKLLAGTYDLSLIDVAGRAVEKTFTGRRVKIRAASFSPDERYALVCRENGATEVWDLTQEDGAAADTAGHSSEINALAFDPTGRWLASGGEDTRVCVWDAEDMAPLLTYRGHDKPVEAIAFSPDGVWVLSQDAFSTLHCWERETGRLLFERRTRGSAPSIEFVPDGILMNDTELYDWNGTLQRVKKFDNWIKPPKEGEPLYSDKERKKWQEQILADTDREGYRRIHTFCSPGGEYELYFDLYRQPSEFTREREAMEKKLSYMAATPEEKTRQYNALKDRYLAAGKTIGYNEERARVQYYDVKARSVLRTFNGTFCGGQVPALAFTEISRHTGEIFMKDHHALFRYEGRVWLWDILNDGVLARFTSGYNITGLAPAPGWPCIAVGTDTHAPLILVPKNMPFST